MLEEATGYSAQDIGQRMEQVDELQELVATAADAASRSTSEDKRRLLARAAAAGILGDESVIVDDRVLFVRTLDQVDVPHMKLLVLLAEPRGRLGPLDVTGGWTAHEIMERWPGVTAGIEPLLAGLQREGLASQSPPDNNVFASVGGATWVLTEYGGRFVNFVRTGAPAIRPEQLSG